tara:strand:+ start:429 stop:572 length:144 start_codon:yes stop_codon:yes gene_type:complete
MDNPQEEVWDPVDLVVEDLVEEVDLVQSQLKMELLILVVAVEVVDLI